ncbi:metallophosphoesterase family protein [Dinghuibacter silviterrae]|uniref:3',5'-cyclic AMP phosphodiesterase CpdA n=1 Tax=Dinghuibacter silviterrae TaxID=1539049 RepID=A0A4R8DFN3_9BACT|nr:metallophosphoesterase [Dinghuibacter silviterrae]TDW95896.1 3',5'-cyclic AMP phosphodiesterase CpdA [Dinghuibacter silviterrae]
MERRSFVKSFPLAAVALGAAPAGKKKKPVLTVAHITDIHITKGDAPAKFKQCLEQVKQHKPDFFLNGGDSIMDASYDKVPREQVTELWSVWDECVQSTLQHYDMYACIGNHDTWWAAPSHEDDMYGKDYVVKRLGIPHRYYSFDKGGWHFIILDGNNKGISLDEEQMEWLSRDLDNLQAGTPTLVMSHYPILGVIPILEGGGHSDSKQLKTLFYKHRDKVKVCISGHEHLVDTALYNGVHYFCNGAVSGFWWGKGDEHSAGPYYYEETPPGYAILELYADGSVENRYYPMEY